ncbi:MAG TPA: hypothetical protein VNP92_12065 [Actinophytocola sp.]|nr:hypothetical protein [Actinophytocola sp.]
MQRARGEGVGQPGGGSCTTNAPCTDHSPEAFATRSADALAALAFGSIPAWLRGLIAAVHRSVLGLQLDVSSTVPVPGWRRLRGEPDEVVYGADGRLLTPRLVVSVTSTTVPVHRVIARVLLDRGVLAASRQDAKPADT